MKRLTSALVILMAFFVGTAAAQTKYVAVVETEVDAQSKIDASGILTDSRNGKRYETALIGGKRWMRENLNYKTSSGSWCYDDSDSYCDKYGRLYDWKTAKKTVCPAGFHLPSRQEWQSLVNSAGGDNKAGKRLKYRSGWNNKGNGTDEYEFSALPGGCRLADGYFYDVGNIRIWWTDTEYSGSNAYSRSMGYYRDGIRESNEDTSAAFSVRCVED